MTPEEKDILRIAENFQEDCHRTVETILYEKKGRASVQDATNVWIFRKLAELQYELNNRPYYSGLPK